MRELLSPYFNLIFKAGLVLIIFSTLFVFTNQTTEYYDTVKFLILALLTLILLIFLSIKFTLHNRVVLNRTPLDLPLLLLLVVAIVSTFLSPSPYISILGNQLKVHGSLVSVATYVLFYFVLTNNFKSVKDIKWVLYLMVIFAQILSAVSLLTYFGLKVLPPPWTHGANFTPTGSSFSTTAILVMLLPLVISQILTAGSLATKLINAAFLSLMGITIALTGNLATWVGGGVAVAGSLFFGNLLKPAGQNWSAQHLLSQKPLNLAALAVPLILVALAAIISFIPASGNILYSQARSFPREIEPPFVASWKVSVSAFRDLPFWGTGPGTYAFNFTNYKPIEFNSSKFWNLRFDSSFNEYLQVLATLGGVGILALVSFTALFLSSAYGLLMNKNFTPNPLPFTLNKALAISGLSFFVMLLLHPSTLPLWVIGLTVFAMFMVINNLEGMQQSFSGGFRDIKNFILSGSTQTLKIDALPGVLVVIFACLSIFTVFFGGKFALADFHHRKALDAVAQNQGLVAYNELVAAEKFNPYTDSYRTDLAQTNFALANAIALSKGPTEASPAGSFTDQDRQNIQTLLQQAINEGRTATTLSPRSAINWEILGALYRQIAGVAENALIFALDSYGHSIQNDPLNPLLRLNVGGTYYAIRNYDLAIRFFTDSINLKPDFANGYYNLSVALRDKGDLNGALAAAERVVALVDPASSDYKIATDYLNDLKAKVSGPPAEPPSATASGALQQEELPNVVDVGNPPEKIATPAAVKKPGATPEPSPSPNP